MKVAKEEWDIHFRLPKKSDLGESSQMRTDEDVTACMHNQIAFITCGSLSVLVLEGILNLCLTHLITKRILIFNEV